MSSLIQIFLYVLNFLIAFYVGVCSLRFLLQLTGADYYNPLSQAIVKATKLPVQLFRKVIPSYKNIDFASLVWTVLVAFLIIEAVALVFTQNLVNPGIAILWALLGIANLVVNIYFFGIILMAILSWISPRTVHPAVQLVAQIVEPVLRPIRRALPAFGGIDFSPMLVILVLILLQRSVLPELMRNLIRASQNQQGPILVPGLF